VHTQTALGTGRPALFPVLPYAALWVLVVGAGSAGAALAARLLEQASARVLLMEAGPDYRTVDTPPEIQSLNWPESPAPRPLLAGVTARPTDVRVPVLYVRGAGVGGNSAIKAAGAVRRVPGALMFGGDRAGRAPRLLGVRVGPGQR
jgi:choline dehydrogenase-like flavoprotein